MAYRHRTWIEHPCGHLAFCDSIGWKKAEAPGDLRVRQGREEKGAGQSCPVCMAANEPFKPIGKGSEQRADLAALISGEEDITLAGKIVKAAKRQRTLRIKRLERRIYDGLRLLVSPWRPKSDAAIDRLRAEIFISYRALRFIEGQTAAEWWNARREWEPLVILGDVAPPVVMETVAA